MKTHIHHMPFGTELLSKSEVRFRLWAPNSQRVDVCIAQGSHENIIPMEPEADGWFGVVANHVSAGDQYQYLVDSETRVPDPASRCQAQDIHGSSIVLDPRDFNWTDDAWHGRPWEEAIVYELHVGTFTPEGSFGAVEDKLDYFLDLGITAIELMPVADFPGARNWGYDGALLFAPDVRYGSPQDLKSLVNAAHEKGLMIFLDVVYNHFGPEGNYLHLYAPQFFTERHHTPWGAAINYDGENSYWVREFFIHNALYWLEEYHFDGLRLDAVHAILDDSTPDILTELAQRVHDQFKDSRKIHLVLENDNNASHYLQRHTDGITRWYDAQWNDDIHHAFHVLFTGESDGYYVDYADQPMQHLQKCLAEGLAYQGEQSLYRNHQQRGEPSSELPATAFVSFLQNHDQIGNRAFGERIHRLCDAAPIRAAMEIILLAPSPPLLFMGQEWGCEQPFLYFCDLGDDLKQAVIDGRRQEFTRFPQFKDPASREQIPNPLELATFNQSVLDWETFTESRHQSWLKFHSKLLELRKQHIFPNLSKLKNNQFTVSTLDDCVLQVRWQFGEELYLNLLTNLSAKSAKSITLPSNNVWYYSPVDRQLSDGILPGWSVIWSWESSG